MVWRTRGEVCYFSSFTSGVVMKPIRASSASFPFFGFSVPALRRVTCAPYSPVMVPSILVRTEKPVISFGPLRALPLQLQVTFGMPLVSVGLMSALPPRSGVTPSSAVERSVRGEEVEEQAKCRRQAPGRMPRFREDLERSKLLRPVAARPAVVRFARVAMQVASKSGILAESGRRQDRTIQNLARTTNPRDGPRTTPD